MKYPKVAYAGLALATGTLSACSPYLHSPPGRLIASQTAKALNKGETAVQAEAGGGIGSEIGLAGGNLRVRHGVGKNVDVSGDFSYTQITSEEFVDAIDGVLSARAGVKYALGTNFAVAGGVAGGGWAGGGFISPDVNLILSKENPKFVPYLDVGLFTSHPVAGKVVQYRDEAGLAPFTFGWTVGAGFRVPIRRLPDRTNHGILFGFRYIGVRFDNPVGGDLDQGIRNEPYLTFSLGYEHVFVKKKR